MKFVSWNVNGLRACLNKGFADYFAAADADFFCLQETKMQEGQADVPAEGYEVFWNYAEKKGYSGTAVFARHTPLSVRYGIGNELHDHEGRVITLEYPAFFLVTVYTPNSQRELNRLSYRVCWEEDFRQYLLSLDREKPVVVCGDMNVAHRAIDLKNPKSNEKNAGYTIEERTAFSRLLDSGFVDSFRWLNPDAKDCYTWWSYMFRAREKNVGWRIDYFLVSERLKDSIKDAGIESSVMGSDHCPVTLTLDVDA